MRRERETERMRVRMRMKTERKTERRAGREEYSYYLLYLLDGTRIFVRWNPVAPGSDL